MEITLPTPEEINRQITETIAKSTIGTVLAEVIQERVKEWAKDYNSPLKKVVDTEIHRLLLATLRAEPFNTQLLEMTKRIVAEKLSEKVVGGIIDVAFDKLMGDK